MIIIFRGVVQGKEFLSLSTEELIELISSDVLNAPEEKVSNFSKPNSMCIVFYYIGWEIILHTHYYIYIQYYPKLWWFDGNIFLSHVSQKNACIGGCTILPCQIK